MATDPHLRRVSERDEYSPINPEALLISAYLEQGSFMPESQHVEDSDIVAWGKLWQGLKDYQGYAHKTPSLNYIKNAYPEFTFTPGVNVDYAASLVRKDAAARSLRMQIHAGLDALNDDDIDTAYGALDAMKRPRLKDLTPVSVFDHATVVEAFESSFIPLPFPTLRRAAKGIYPGEYWIEAARLGQGKTYVMLKYAAVAAKAGYNIGIHALEMPAGQVARRLHPMLTSDVETLRMLRSDSVSDHKKALDHIRENTLGSVSILDPSHGRINTTGAIADSCSKYDMVIVDHLGLMMTTDGHRAIEDWRYMAEISNICRETALSSGTPIFASAQINRAGETAGNKAPSSSNLAQSDAIGQDADVVLTMKRLNALVLVHSAQKMRNGANVDWFSEFNPAANRFDEISKDRADELSMLAEDISQR
jgi:replicative DNA helicase